MKATVRHLRVFDAVASCGSIIDAAAQLNMSQSAASTALKDFQLALNRPPLFHRVGRGLQITAEGKRLHPRVRSLLRDLAELEAPSGASLLEATIAIGVADSSYFLPPLVVAFRKLHPGVRVNVTIGQSQVIVEQFTRFAIDVVITDSMARPPGSYLTEIFRDRSVLVVAPDHPLAGVARPSFADLEENEWCLPGRATLSNLKLNDMIRGHIANLRVAMEINSDEGLREAVKAGAGVTCLPLSLIGNDLASGRLVELRLENFNFFRPTYLLRMKNIKSMPAVSAFEHFLIDNYAIASGDSGSSEAINPAAQCA